MQSSEGLFHIEINYGYGFESQIFRNIGPMRVEHKTMRITIVNKQSRPVYFLTFESLSREWPESEMTGRTMIESLKLNSEY